MKAYRLIEHTADVGLQIYGKDLQELFAHAARGLFDLMTPIDTMGKKAVSARQVRKKITLKGSDVKDLFLKWLKELLFLFDTEKIVFTSFDPLKIEGDSLEAEGVAVIFDPAVHDQKIEVKAVTYHGFKMEKQKKGWTAEVIFDI